MHDSTCNRDAYCRCPTGEKELYDDLEDPYPQTNPAVGRKVLKVLATTRNRRKESLAAAHDDFLPGTAYGEWYDDLRNLRRTGLGPVPG